MVNIDVEVLDPKLVPVYANIGDAGADLVASQAAVVPAKGRILVKTGLKLALPMGYVGLVHPRSGLALKHGITVLNTPGTIDSGYRGEGGVILYNSTDSDFEVQIGDRIAQLVIQKYETGIFNIVDSLGETSRGDGGFGSTGVGEL